MAKRRATTSPTRTSGTGASSTSPSPPTSGFVDGYTATQALLTEGATALDEPLPGGSPTPDATQSPTELPPSELTPLLTDFKALVGAALSSDATSISRWSASRAAFEVLAVDPFTSEIGRTTEVPSAVQIQAAAGSVWVSGGGGTEPCSVTRLDGATLEPQATVEVPCALFGPTLIARLDDAIWFIDQTTADPQGKGAHAAPDRSVHEPARRRGRVAVPERLPVLQRLGDLLLGRSDRAGTGCDRAGRHSRSWAPATLGEWVAMSYGPPPRTGPWPRLTPVRAPRRRGCPPSGRSSRPTPRRSTWSRRAAEALTRCGGYRSTAARPSRCFSGGNVTVGQTQRELGFFDDNPLLIGSGTIVKVWPVVENAENPQSALFTLAESLP